MIGSGFLARRCWGGAGAEGATRVVATYTCQWCGKTEEVVLFDECPVSRGPEGWVDVWRSDIGRELRGVFCSVECQELEVATWRQALRACMERGELGEDGEAWTEGLVSEYERLKADRPF